MDYQKLDAALIAALERAEAELGVRAADEFARAEGLTPLDDPARSDRLARSDDPARSVGAGPPTFDVFIHTTHPLQSDEADYLTSLGVRGAAPRRRIITATLPAPAIEALSEAEWVRALHLSRALSLAPAVKAPPAQPSDPTSSTRRPIDD